MSQVKGFEDKDITPPAAGRVRTVVKVIIPLVIAVGLLAACTTATTASPMGHVTSTVGATPIVKPTPRVPLSTRLLTGTFSVPPGFTVGSINPLVPADAAPFGEVTASVTSPGGVAYDAIFSPTVVPCDYAACTETTTTLVVGNAAPPDAQVTIDPDVGTQAQCGYNSDTSEVACDAIRGEEYISVRGNGPGISTADAVVVLRAALDHLSQSGG